MTIRPIDINEQARLRQRDFKAVLGRINEGREVSVRLTETLLAGMDGTVAPIRTIEFYEPGSAGGLRKYPTASVIAPADKTPADVLEDLAKMMREVA